MLCPSMQRDIIDNRESYLSDAVQPLLTQSEQAHFAVGFSFLSGLIAIDGPSESIKKGQSCDNVI